MPIYDLGYRGWQGRKVPEAGRFLAIAATGIRLAWRSKFLRRMLLLAGLPIVYAAILLFVFEQVKSATEVAEVRVKAAALTRGMPPSAATDSLRFLRDVLPQLPPDVEAHLRDLDRHYWWSVFLWIYFRYPQGVLIVLVVGIVAPPLVAQDVRSRAFLLYFSRPLTRVEYILGKMTTVWAYVLTITAVPALCLYVLGVFLSPQLSVVRETWDLPLRIALASAVLMVPTTALALAFSSLTSESRYATAAWFGVWVIGWVTYSIVSTSFPAGVRTPAQATLIDRVTLASLYHSLGRVQHWVFGLEGFSAVKSAAIELAAITVVSLVVLFRRVSSPMRI